VEAVEMVGAFARLGQRYCAHLTALAVAASGVSYFAPRYLAASPDQPVALHDSDLIKIDAVLAQKSPELGLSLRRRVADAVLDESRRARFDPLFVLALIEVESSFDGEAVSWAGARGLMQLTPVTLVYLAGLEGMRLSAQELWRDPALQVRLGVRYLSRLEKRFGSLDLALMAYNAGPEKIRLATVEGDIERFKPYVGAVRRDFARFRRGVSLQEGSALARAGEPPLSPRVP
jgi:soluble lytic murein transglycosylase